MRMVVGAIAATALVFTLSSATAAVGPGSLDPRFGSGGKVVSSFTSGHDFSAGLVVVPDGKIVVGGDANGNFLLVRYTAAGKLDRSFGTGGKVTTDFGGNDAVRGLVRQRDGKLVLAGFTQFAGVDRVALARYTAQGTLDPTFGAGGKVITAFASTTSFAEGIALGKQGKLVVAGAAQVGSSLDVAVARYNPNGSLDSSFSGDGMATRDVAFGDIAYDVLVRPDGSVVAAGIAGSGSSNQDLLLAGFDSGGNPLGGFGSGGNVTADFAVKSDAAYGVTLAPNGDVIAVGYAGIGSNFDSAFFVVKPNGTPDSSFDGDGKKTLEVTAKADTLDAVTVVPGLFPQAPRRIVAVGSAVTGANNYDCELVSLDLRGEGWVRIIHQSDHDDYCGSIGIADRGIGARDLVLFGGDDPSSARSRIVGVEIFADEMSSSCPYRSCRFFGGTNGADRITGTRGRDVMLGRGGNDVLIGRGGTNVFNGGPGTDTCRGKGRKISCERH